MAENEEIQEAEVINHDAVTVNDTGKSFDLVTACDDPEKLFLDKNNFLPLIKQVTKIARGLVADVNTAEGVKARKAMNKKLASLKNSIEDAGKAVAAGLKAKPKMVDETRRTVKQTLEMLQDEVMAPIREIEARQAEIVEICNLPAEGIGCDSEGLRCLLERLEAMAKNPEYWKESAKDAEDAVRDAKRQLNDMLASAEKAEADARELEELRKHKEELERIEREKREEELRKAQEEAARLAKEKEEAEAKAKAMEEAKAKAEADKVEAERKATEAMDRLSENDRAIVNVGPIEPLFPDMEREHKRKVNNEALDAIVKIDELLKLTGGDVNDAKSVAKAIITAIAKGQIPHVRIVYIY